jgi:MFS family permease
MYNNGILALGMLCHTLTTELVFLIPIRFFLGVTLSLNEGICKALVVEFSPLNIRGKITSLLTCMFVLGNILSGIICVLYWDDFDEGDWKQGYIIFTIMAIISFLSSIFILRESARFMLANG